MKGVLTKGQRVEIERQMARCMWFSPKEAMAWVLAAYHGAARSLAPPEGEPWDGWSSPSGFAATFHERLSELLSNEIVRRGFRDGGWGPGGQLIWADHDQRIVVPLMFVRSTGFQGRAENDAPHEHDLPPPTVDDGRLIREGKPNGR